MDVKIEIDNSGYEGVSIDGCMCRITLEMASKLFKDNDCLDDFFSTESELQTDIDINEKRIIDGLDSDLHESVTLNIINSKKMIEISKEFQV